MAIRIARRDARRYKWRSALIVAMVGLPVLVMTSGITLISTQDVSTAESVPRLMGYAQARIDVPAAGGGGSGALTPVPGFTLDSDWTTGKVQRVTGGRVIQTMPVYTRVVLGDRRPRVPVLAIDGRDPLARGMTELVSGRWAGTSSEIVVTQAGVAGGLPPGGALTAAGRDGRPRPMTVVGVANAHAGTELPLLVALPGLARDLALDEQESPSFLIERGTPVTSSDVRRMSHYGLMVQSREVLLNPPTAVGPDSPGAQGSSSGLSGFDVVLLLAAVGLFIETTLLAGPAFAVSAARQRRSLALAASNGAEARQLRRYVLGQAVVLGILSAAVAVVGGVLLTLAGLTWWKSGHADFVTGPFDVSWPRVVGVFLCAVVASVVAALLPARGIGRLDIVAVLAGRSGARPAHRGLPAAGFVVMVLSGTGLIWSVTASGQDALGAEGYILVLVLGTIALVLGCLMVIPALLALVGRLGAHLVLPLRLAARDTARQRGRSTPAVAAIMAAVAGLTALSIGAASNARHSEDAYQPSRPMGSGGISFLHGKDSDEAGVRKVIARFAPQLEVDRIGEVRDADDVAPNNDRHAVSWVALLPPGCSEAKILASFEAEMSLVPQQGVDICWAPAAHSLGVRSLSQLSALPLSKSQRTLLEEGGMLTTDPKLMTHGQVSLVGGSKTRDRAGVVKGRAVNQRTRVPAAVLDLKIWESAFGDASPGTWILPETATRLGWPVRGTALSLSSPTGTISPQVEQAVADRLGNGSSMYVERGYQNESWLILLILFSVTGLLVLIASLISTALSLAESQNDMATLAAVGATRHTSRAVAASQALVVAACGTLLGVAVGMIPGIASTWPLTTPSSQSPTIAIPWLPLVAVCLGVPLLAGALAWIAVRRHPQMTRRLA